MQRGFSFEHLQAARLGDPMHFHAYQLLAESSGYKIQLAERWSTDTNGIAQCLGLQTSSKVELEMILQQIEEKLPQSMLLSVDQPVPMTTHDISTDNSEDKREGESPTSRT